MKPQTDNPAFALDRLAIAGEPDSAALTTRAGTLSYKMLNHRVGQIARWLEQHGLAKGDRVASWLPKTELACVLPLAVARAEMVYVPVNALLKPGQVGHIIEDSGARLLITNTPRVKSLEKEPPGGDCSISSDKEVEQAADAVSDSLPPNSEDFDTNKLAALLYTSGSTGRPKGVMLSHANLSIGAVSVAEYLKLADSDRTLCVLPLSFDYGQNQLLSTWMAGGCAVPLDYLTPRDVIKACIRGDITTLAAVPPLWVQLVEQEWPPEAVDSMRRLTNSGGALTSSLVKQLRKIFGSKTDIYAMYGLTEAFRSTFLDPDFIDENPTSMGKAIPHAEIMVISEFGEIAAPDEEGELVHAGPLVGQGYWQDPERTSERYQPAPEGSRYGGMAVWSGDTVKRGPDGLLYFVGRTDSMIKSSGNRISPSEIEKAALDSGLIAEAAAMGVPDERLGHAIRLFVRGSGDRNGADDKEALETWLKRNLPNFMYPQDIVWLNEFPKNPNGKIDRNALKEGALT
ncbi:MAG: acyl-CoA ligase (AMP-forming), exosortase A system-associated [Pseudomonadota bacterium]